MLSLATPRIITVFEVIKSRPKNSGLLRLPIEPVSDAVAVDYNVVGPSQTCGWRQVTKNILDRLRHLSLLLLSWVSRRVLIDQIIPVMVRDKRIKEISQT